MISFVKSPQVGQNSSFKFIIVPHLEHNIENNNEEFFKSLISIPSGK